MDACKYLVEETRQCHIITALSDTPYKAGEADCQICEQMKKAQGINCYTMMVANSVREQAGTFTNEHIMAYAQECGNDNARELETVLTNIAPAVNHEAIDLKADNRVASKRFEEGPGTELGKLISWFAEPVKGCGCKDYKKKMNRWGVKGCIKYKEQILDHLMGESKKKGWPHGQLARFATSVLLTQAIKRVDPQAHPGFAADDAEFHVAITTAPRKEPTVHTCIESFREAGWEPMIYAEPESEKTNCVQYTNGQRQGVWRNWVKSVKIALESGSKYIITAQDDIIIHPQTRDLVEWVIEHKPQALEGFLSLYTPKHYSEYQNRPRPTGINRIRTHSLWGACCLVWKREVLEQVIAHPLVDKWLGAPLRTKSAQERVFEQRRKFPYLIANSDTAIGKIMNRLDLPMYFVDPSPANHIASHSAIGHGGNRGRRNCGRCADSGLSIWEQIGINQ